MGGSEEKLLLGGVLGEDGCLFTPAESGRPRRSLCARRRPRPALQRLQARAVGTPVRGGLSPYRAEATSFEKWWVLVWPGVELRPRAVVRGVVEHPTASPPRVSSVAAQCCRLPLCPLALGRKEPPGLADLDHGGGVC